MGLGVSICVPQQEVRAQENLRPKPKPYTLLHRLPVYRSGFITADAVVENAFRGFAGTLLLVKAWKSGCSKGWLML